MENESVDKNKSIIPVTLAVLLVLAVGAYFFYGFNKTGNTGSVVNSGGAGVATVNGTIIPKEVYDAQLESAVSSYKTQGIDVANVDNLSRIKTEVLDGLINNELVAQNILIAGIKIAPEEVEKQFQLILTQAGGADEFKAELLKNNLTEVQLRENIARQLTVQAYLAQNVDIKSIAVSEDEIGQFYTNYSKAQKDSGKESVPSLKDLSAQIEQQLISNKQQVLITEFINSLRTKAKIEVTSI